MFIKYKPTSNIAFYIKASHRHIYITTSIKPAVQLCNQMDTHDPTGMCGVCDKRGSYTCAGDERCNATGCERARRTGASHPTPQN